MRTTTTTPPEDLRGRTALVTGASTGIGAEFAERLAQAGVHLVIVARSKAVLEARTRDLREQYGVDVLPIALDLSVPGAAADLIRAVIAADIDVDVLVNNAGVTVIGSVATADPAATSSMVGLNVTALTELTVHFLKPMVDRQRGTIVNVASNVAFQPAPYLAVYSATKAYVLSFTEALWAENRDTGVRVLALCPGRTETPMNSGAGRGKRTPRQVVDTAMAALATDKFSVVDGTANAVIARAFSQRFPSRAVLAVAERFARPSPPR